MEQHQETKALYNRIFIGEKKNRKKWQKAYFLKTMAKYLFKKYWAQIPTF